jgi:hypothetical protein
MRTFFKRLADFSPSCKTATRLQSEGMDRPLPLTQRVGLRIHLVLCKWCRRYGSQIHFLREAAHEHPEPEPTAAPTLSTEARERIKKRLQSGG